MLNFKKELSNRKILHKKWFMLIELCENVRKENHHCLVEFSCCETKFYSGFCKLHTWKNNLKNLLRFWQIMILYHSFIKTSTLPELSEKMAYLLNSVFSAEIWRYILFRIHLFIKIIKLGICPFIWVWFQINHSNKLPDKTRTKIKTHRLIRFHINEQRLQ